MGKAPASKPKPVIVIAASLVAVVFGYLIYDRTRPSCDGVFEQTVTKIGGNVEFIKNKGALYIGPEKVQELTEGSQQIALHLKTCCIGQQSNKLNADQYLACLNGAKEYQGRVTQVVNIIKEAQAAKDQGNLTLFKEKAAQATEAASGVKATVTQLAGAVKPLAPDPPARSVTISDVEKEPNDTIFQPNAAPLGRPIAGEIATPNDTDFYKFRYHDDKKRRDILVLSIDNPTPSLQPATRIYTEDQQVLQNWIYPNVAGARLSTSVVAAPDQVFFVQVGNWSSTAGKYSISFTPQKAWDRYEPNEDAATATPITFRQSIEANIMDPGDVDWYHLTGIKDKSLTVHVENLSNTLQPAVRIHTEDRQLYQNWQYPNTAGAHLDVAVAVEAGKSYFVVVSNWSNTSGNYKLSTR